MLQALLSSTALVAASEMGDKTQLLAFALASRFKRPGVVLTGIFAATLVNHALAASVGSYFSKYFTPCVMSGVLGGAFIGFGFWALKPDSLDEVQSGGDASAIRVFWTTAIAFFLAEMGDKTQFATLALGAKFHAPVPVTLGTTLGMMLSDGLAVWIGDRLAHVVKLKRIRIGAAMLFFIFGLVSLAQLISGSC